MILGRLKSQPDEALAAWVALFRAASTLEVSKAMAWKTVGSAAQIVRRAASGVTRAVRPDLQQKLDAGLLRLEAMAGRPEQVFQQRFHEARLLPRAELLAELQRHIASTCGVPAAAGLDDPLLDRAAVVTAATHYGIDARGRSVDDLARQVFVRTVQDLAERAQQQLGQATPEQLARVERLVEKQIARLGESDREQLREALGVDRLTGRAVVRALRSGAAAGAAWWLMNASGFALYTAASSILHAVFTGLLGITLPFGIYAGTASGLALLTGPLGLAVIPAIWGWISYRGSRETRRRLIALLVTSLLVSDPEDGTSRSRQRDATQPGRSDGVELELGW